ncbi:hypothetical protein MYCTH_2294618 [Thermothelomyces thermophilus ATCC 42464]|uniref:DUF7492 domain-containing protein n=1 Tax=Thermothelomyces thermophilus (strain ATCC 42464 / BCRC 31852 / DSM 1799) TaxID=573729 RepID=G2Q253_THET4|nr:uncharacterized protein MYCTH_2294618 [Thermothelomyces thermophilus ATCC 42464]AEO53380.1 hypothetical protein MYCTH_2294618 [Thermothelomyces thermophilus ATCC 42464]
MRTSIDRIVAAWLLAALSGTATAHSWPEQTVRLGPDGKEVGKPGADRAHIENGPDASFLIPPNGGPKVFDANQKIVRDGQGTLTDSSYSDQFPMLSVAPGDFVAIKHRENGHVTRADKTNPMKPINRGTIYLYGTTENDLSNVNLMDVHLKWTADGKGGDGKGRLLATRNYDDGQCHEQKPADGDLEGIGDYRKQHVSNADSLLCQSDIKIPEDAPVGKIYTVIWVWDWPDMKEPGVAVPPAEYNSDQVATPETYTGVVDFKIVDPCDESLGEVKGPTCKSSTADSNVKFAMDAPATARGIPSQLAEPFIVKVPQAGASVPSATADPKYIPFAVLIGQEPTEFPLPQSILEKQNTPGAAGGGGGGVPTPTPTPSPDSGSGSGGGDEEEVVTITTTVPEGFTTMTVTRSKAEKTPEAKPRGILLRRRHRA